MTDTHCHPQFPQYDADRGQIIKNAFENGVKIICVGTDLEMSRKAIKLATDYENIWASVGLHPNDNLGEEYDQAVYRELAGHERVVAIGEIGLDYYRTAEPDKIKIQQKRFEKQLELAENLDKPLILHCRDGTRSAHEDMFALLKNIKTRGVIHSFTSSWQNAKRYIDMGFCIGFNGIITFPPSPKASAGHGTRDYDETIKNMPLEFLLLETDAPYLTPIPHRGKRNEPAFVKLVAEKIAELRNIGYQEVEEATDINAKNLFGLKL